MRKSTEYILVACAIITTIFVCTFGAFVGSRLISNHKAMPTEKQHIETNRELQQNSKPDPEKIITLFFSLLKDLIEEDKKAKDENLSKQQ
jgi:hypothetical protein